MIAALTTHALDDLIAATLRAPDPACELRGMVRALLASGDDREALIRDLNRYRLDLEAAGREQDGNALFDVLDALSGWCSPDQELSLIANDEGARRCDSRRSATAALRSRVMRANGVVGQFRVKDLSSGSATISASCARSRGRFLT